MSGECVFSSDVEKIDSITFGRHSFRNEGGESDSVGVSYNVDRASVKVLPGVFSVSADKKVQFSNGSVQFCPFTNTWRFAPGQFYVSGADNSYVNDSLYKGWLDLFCWSVVRFDSKNFGVSSSTNQFDYQGAFVDWAEIFNYNDEYEDGDTLEHKYGWYTMSSEEWDYLLKKRKNAEHLVSLATIYGIKGVMLLPDNCYSLGVKYSPTKKTFDVNVYGESHYRYLKDAGVVFLPSLGIRNGIEVKTTDLCSYWSSTPVSTSHANCFEAWQLYFGIMIGNSYDARGVRLVREVR